ncbi:hemolysin family protein [Methyloferula stellata]|uniref:hemolysin family protein n=1 Tax=Methyloferula stellata TaxID=876270 RepID=UPI00036B4D3B
MMSEHDPRAAGEAQGERPQPAKPTLFDRLRTLFGMGGVSVRDDIEDALATTSTEADLSAQERAMLKNVLDLHEVKVEDLMVPRADIIAVAIDASLHDVLSLFRTAGHSRFPVHGETLDDPRGMVHIRDFLDYLATGPQAAGAEKPMETPSKLPTIDLSLPLSEAKILRPVLFVPPSMPALDLLVKMQATRTHMALIIDEYGGTDGLASIEDIVEMIVGDIEDEHDFDEGPDVEAAADGTFVANARAALDDVWQTIGVDLDLFTDAEDVDTLGGLVTALAGHVPVRGEIIAEGPFEFEILDADPRRVKKIKIRRRVDPVTPPASAAPAAGDTSR